MDKHKKSYYERKGKQYSIAWQKKHGHWKPEEHAFDRRNEKPQEDWMFIGEPPKSLDKLLKG